MEVVMSISVKLPFDISKAENDAEKKVAKALHNNMVVEYVDRVECYVKYDDDLWAELEEDGIDEETFEACIKHFEERGLLMDNEDSCFFTMEKEEGEICKLGDSSAATFRRFD
jgi:hypothetical protein